ncbi:MAG TPA: ABC transporter permease subunit, partial [Armatimonadetes bacterium]|nr:ABC transporter permease subunit [Armatimonadota bacterium]
MGCCISFFGIQLGDWLAHPIGAGFIIGLSYSPIAVLILLMALHNVPREVAEDALFDVTHWRVLLKVITPLITPAIGGCAALLFLLAMLDFGVADFLGVRTLAFEIFFLFDGIYDVHSATVTSLLFSIVTLFVFLILWRWLRRPLTEPRALQRGWHWEMHGFWYGCAVGTGITLALVLTALPLASLFIHAIPELAVIIRASTPAIAHSVICSASAAILAT